MLKKQKFDLLKEINSFRVEIGFFHENSVIFVHVQSPTIFFNFKLLRKIDFLQKSFLSLTSVMAFDIEALRKAIYLKLENNYFSIFKQVYHCAVEQLKLITS